MNRTMRIFSNDRGKMKILLVVALAALVGGVGVLAFARKGASRHQKKVVKEVPKEMVSLDEFVVNLADEHEARYLKTELSLEVTGAEGKGEIDKLKPKVQDAVIGVLSSKHYDELLSESGKEILKKQIAKSLNGLLEKSKVDGVFFTSFAMQ